MSGDEYNPLQRSILRKKDHDVKDPDIFSSTERQEPRCAYIQPGALLACEPTEYLNTYSVRLRTSFPLPTLTFVPVSVSDHHELDAHSSRSPSEGSRSERSTPTSTSTGYTSSPSSKDGPEQQTRRGHYRGITFDDILPPHLITNAPPPNVDPKQKTKSASRAPTPSTATTTTMAPSKRNYPSAKKSSGGGKSRMRATARALIRSLSVVKRGSRGRGGYEAV